MAEKLKKCTEDIKMNFSDRMVFNPNEKTAVSIRDGVLEYLGVELGFEPADKVFTVYRSPATIANAAARMPGIPLTDDHIDIGEVPQELVKGSVMSSEMIDAYDELTKTTIATKNKLTIDDEMRANVESGKRELSLGYTADLVPHSEYDYEQKDIMPWHLAVVEAGRCGPMCSFLDRKPTGEDPMTKKLPKAFVDESGAVNMQLVAELVASLPDLIRQMPLEKLNELVPVLQEALGSAKESGAEMPEEEPTEDESGTGEKPDGEMADEDMTEEEKPNFSDSAEFKDAVAKAVSRHSAVIEKAKSFVDEEYSFEDKTTEQIMRDALKTQSTETFEDSELAVAFKLLRKASSDYSKFGDAKTGGLAARLEQELGE